MPDRQLVWFQDAINEYFALVNRRKNKLAVRTCVEGHLLAVAGNIDLARTFQGPGELLHYDFQCKDGEVILYLRAIFQVINDTHLALLNCNTALM
jgi:hypothetical protein